MNIKQLRIVLEVAKCGSISKAAHNLYMSQPSASSTIQALEDELGYQLFYRANTGIALTELGEKFLAHAKRMLSEAEEIIKLKSAEHTYTLRLGMLGYAPAADAFLRLCETYSGCGNANLSCTNVSVEEGLRALANLQLDVVALLISPIAQRHFLQNVDNYNFGLRHITDVPLNINLRSGHPLLGGGSFNFDMLAEYPYADYEWMPGLTDVVNTIMDGRLKYKYCIAVDERDTRCRVVGLTDAYSIGCKTTNVQMQRYNIVSVPLDGVSAGLYCVFRKGESSNPEINCYIKLLCEQVANI